MKLMKKLLCLSLALFAVVSLTACDEEEVQLDSYTYRSYSTSLGNNWNPHAWETNADSSMLGYVSSPFVDMSILDSKNGVYQWVYEMATKVEDVTAQHQADLTKYGSTLPTGKTADQVEEGYVFDITLNPNAKWETGEAIDADDYIESLQWLLHPKMKNYRANLYIEGESAIAGAASYYNSESPIYSLAIDLETEVVTDAEELYIGLDKSWALSSSYSIGWFVANGYIVDAEDDPETTDVNEESFGATYYEELSEQANPYGYVKITPENKEKVEYLIEAFLGMFSGAPAYNEDGTPSAYYYTLLYYVSGVGEKVEFDAVGCYKVDDYKIRYVLQTAQDLNYFLTSLTSTWLVHVPTYTAGLDTTGELWTTDYCTSLETTVSYGTYKMQSFQQDKQVVYVQNENWYGFTKLEDGSLYSETNFLVDGQKVQQYKTTKIVIDVMDEAAAKLAFLSGDLTDWTPAADELSQYTLSSQLYQVEETYTMSYFFNTSVAALKTMDASKGNKNSVVLSNVDFRKAFSLAIDRAEWVTATAGYSPAYSLMNSLYHYNIYEDPTSSYRASAEAKQAIVDLYGLEYGDGKDYASLDEAYKAINGYNLAEAKVLMKAAHDALVEAELYTSGQDIVINVGYAKGTLTADDNAQIALMNKYLNAAVEGSGFGKVELVGVGNINNRYAAVPAGDYAIGYGAWGGAAFYPFRNFQVYMDPDQYDVNELACWDPTTETFTMTVEGEEVTMTYQEWSNSMIGTGKFDNASDEVKLQITAALEKDFLSKYYRIPLASSTACYMLSYQVGYYTDAYNIMYGFGGMRLMKYAYNDAEWAEYVASQNGKLNYN